MVLAALALLAAILLFAWGVQTLEAAEAVHKALRKILGVFLFLGIFLTPPPAGVVCVISLLVLAIGGGKSAQGNED